MPTLSSVCVNMDADGPIQVRMMAGPGLGWVTFGSFTGFSMSEGMQRCRCNLSASCVWHSLLFRSLLKHRTALCPLWQGRGVEKMGLCFWLARQPNNTPHFLWGEKQDANTSLPLVVESSVISANLWLQTGVSAILLKSSNLHSPENRTRANCHCCGSPHLQLWFNWVCWRMICIIS